MIAPIVPHLRLWFVLGLITLLLVVLRVGWSARGSYLEGQSYLQRGDQVEAARLFEAATHAYLPGIPWPEQAMAQLISLAESAEKQGHTQEAITLWSQVRSSSLGTRWILTPWQEERGLADRHLVELVTAGTRVWPDPSLGREERQKQAEVAFQFEPRPHLGWSLPGLLAFGGVLVGIGGVILRGFKVDGTPRQGVVGRWAGGVLVSIAVWMWCMWMA